MADSYQDAVCPGCGSVLTGSREPGDRDYCQDSEREVTLAPANLNVRAHEVTNWDGPWPGDKWERVRAAIDAHRDGERVPVSFPPRQVDTDTNRSAEVDG